MRTRFLFLDSCYPDAWAILPHRTYDEFWHQCFGTFDSFDCALIDAGHESMTLMAEMESDIIGTAIHLEPRVIVSQNISQFPSRMLREKFPKAKIVGMCSYRASDADLVGWDCLFSSFGWMPEYCASLGQKCVKLPLAFGRKVLERVGPLPEKTIPVTAVCGLGDRHWKAATETIAKVAEQVPGFRWYGYSAGSVPESLKRAYHGPVYGLEYYRTLYSSNLTIARHGEVARGQSNIMRLFEATGIGTALMAENFPNLAEYFQPGVEVVPYDDDQDLIAKIRVLLECPQVIEGIAAQGQRRTLTDHCFENRVPAFLEAIRELK
jgi:hypothetical protein